MKKKSITIIIALLVAVLASFPSSTTAAEYTHIWIDQTTGSNKPETPGTPEKPFKSITYALARADYLRLPEPWHVHICRGVYDANSLKPATEREIFPILFRQNMIFEGGDCSDPNNRTVDPNVRIIDGRHLTQGLCPILLGRDLINIQVRCLTLRNMYHNGNGGAVELVNCAGKIENCIIKDNSATGSGGGLYLSPRPPILRFFYVINCSFANNSANGYGGGFLVNGSLTGSITACSFTDNSANTGGGFRVEGSLTGSITDCSFTNNSANSYDGGGFLVLGSLNGSITGCSFTNNSATYEAGGFRVCGSLIGSITNCSFTNNSGNNGGGFCVNGSITGSITGCTFTNNSADDYWGGGFYVEGSLNGSITGCSFMNNSAGGSGGGFGVWGSLNGSITGCSFTNNSATNYYGGGFIVADPLNGNITGCQFQGNASKSGGEALHLYNKFDHMIENCIFSVHEGTAVYLGANSDANARIRNCLFIAPHTLGGVNGWAIYTNQKIMILNNTMVGPGLGISAQPSAIYIVFGTWAEKGQIVNNIITDTKKGIHVAPAVDMPIKYNCFHNVDEIVCQGEQCLGNDCWWLEWNLSNFRYNYCNTDPLFIAGDPMYHIYSNSPCVDTGDPNHVPESDEADIDSQPRMADGSIDRGADEYYKLTADIYCDGIVNFLDFAVLAGYWQSTEPLADIAPDGGDGVVDLLDLARMCEEWMQKEDWYQGP